MPVTLGTAMRESVRVMVPSVDITLGQVCSIVGSGIYFSYLRAVVTSPVSQVSVFSSLSACLVSSISATAGQMLMRQCEVHPDVVWMLVGGIPCVETSEVAANQSSSEVVDST